MRTFAVLRLMELSIHGWAIRSSLNPLAHVSSESLPVLMELMPEALGWFFQPGPTLPAPVRYRFELTGSRPGSYDIVGHGDKAHLEPAGTAQPNVTFRCETETFVLLMLGRLNLSAATADGRTVVEGDHGLTAEFSQWFRGA